MKGAWAAAALVIMGMVGLVALEIGAQEKREAKVAAPVKERYFEMRIYTAAEGKFEEMQKRFRDHTCTLFKKHGMEIVGFWVPTDEKKKDQLVYILAYPDKDAREASWKAFGQDPDWVKAKADSEKNGKLVAKVESVFMKPADYSPMK